MAESYKLYRGRYIMGLDVPHALVAAHLCDGCVFVERYLLLRGKPMCSCRARFGNGIISEMSELEADGIEGVRLLIEGAWSQLPATVQSKGGPIHTALHEIPFVGVVRLKAFKADLESIRDRTLCRSLQARLQVLLSLRFEDELI